MVVPRLGKLYVKWCPDIWILFVVEVDCLVGCMDEWMDMRPLKDMKRLPLRNRNPLTYVKNRHITRIGSN